VIDALGLGKLSVGPPYFNAVFIPLMAPLALVVGLGMLLRWKSDNLQILGRRLLIPAGVCIGIALLIPLLMPFYSWAAVLGLSLAFWTVAVTAVAFWQRLQKWSWLRLQQIPAGFYGMTLAHLGMAVFVIGITFTSTYSIERDVRLAPEETLDLFGYVFQFHGIKRTQGPNYMADQGYLTVSHGGEVVAELHPQKRVYQVQKMPMTEAAIDAGLFRDLFVAIGEPLGEGGAWSMRVYYKSCIRWIWLGGLFMAAGGLLAAGDRRYRLNNKKSDNAHA
jgi:cytochrome c-type biogenesis protein CcmF